MQVRQARGGGHEHLQQVDDAGDRVTAEIVVQRSMGVVARDEPQLSAGRRTRHGVGGNERQNVLVSQHYGAVYCTLPPPGGLGVRTEYFDGDALAVVVASPHLTVATFACETVCGVRHSHGFNTTVNKRSLQSLGK